MDNEAIRRARDVCAKMTDRQIIEEYRKGAGAVSPEGWAGLQQEFQRRKLRLGPWNDPTYVLLTTAPSVDGYRITRTIDIVSSEFILGVNFLRDMLNRMSDLVSYRSLNSDNVLSQAKQAAMLELRKKARELEADAIIGVDLDYTELSGPTKSMLFLVASGTAVRLERVNS